MIFLAILSALSASAQIPPAQPMGDNRVAFSNPTVSTTTGSGFVDKMRLDSLDNSVRQLQNGRPTITGQPKFQSGFSAGISTFTGTVIFNSSITFNGSVFGTINISTIGFLPFAQTTFTNTTYACIAGSTLTLTTGNNPVLLALNGASVSNNTVFNSVFVTVLVDGATYDGLGVSGNEILAASANNSTDGDIVFPANFAQITSTNLSPGSHAFCIAVRVNATTGKFICNLTSQSTCRFTISNWH